MTEPDWGSFYTVTHPEQTRLLTEPTSKAFFRPFLARERSASEAANELGYKLNTVLYRIKTFLAAGLLEVTHETTRKGRAIKHYRSVHDAYFIPFSLTPYATLEERLEAQGEPIFSTLLRAYAAALSQSERFGNYLLRNADGAVLTTDFVPERTPSGHPVVYSDTVVNLTESEALSRAAGLRALFHGPNSGNPDAVPVAVSAAAPDDAPQHAYLLMVALLPLPR